MISEKWLLRWGELDLWEWAASLGGTYCRGKAVTRGGLYRLLDALSGEFEAR